MASIPDTIFSDADQILAQDESSQLSRLQQTASKNQLLVNTGENSLSIATREELQANPMSPVKPPPSPVKITQQTSPEMTEGFALRITDLEAEEFEKLSSKTANRVMTEVLTKSEDTTSMISKDLDSALKCDQN